MNRRRHRRGHSQSSVNPPRGVQAPQRKQEQKFQQVAPSPLKPLSKIKIANPCGSGLNPLAPKKNDSFAAHQKKGERNYAVVFFENFNDAKKQRESIKVASMKCDQINVVIKAEGDMDDQEILSIDPKVKLFAGAAWTLIHERRFQDGWYLGPHE